MRFNNDIIIMIVNNDMNVMIVTNNNFEFVIIINWT